MAWSFSQFLAIGILVAAASAEDSSDCLSEYKNADEGPSMAPFCNRCKDETGANPLRNRCSLCVSKCFPGPTIPPATVPPPTESPTVPPFKPDGGPIPECELDSSDAVAHGLNAALDIWASTERCRGAILQDAPVKCEQDIAGSIKAVSSMANAIAGMAASCGTIKTRVPECGLAVNKLIGATAGLADASGAVADKCFDINPAAHDKNILGKRTILGKCTINSGKSVNGLFKAVNSINQAKEQCPGGGKPCAVDSLKVISILSNLGAHLAASVEKCAAYEEKNGRELMMPSPCDVQTTATVESTVKPTACAAGIFKGVASLSKLAAIGMTIEKACQVSDSSRLYAEKESEAATGSPLMLAFAAVVPITAVLSFVAGSRVAKSRQQTSVRAVEADEEKLLAL